MSQFFVSGSQSIGASASASVLTKNIHDWFPKIDWFDLACQGTLKSLFQHHSSKALIHWCSAFFVVQLSHPYMTTGKTIALTIRTLIGRVMSLLFNMLFRFVIGFLPRRRCLLISWLHSPSTVILEPKKIKSVTVSIVFPSIFHEVMRPDAMIFILWVLNFRPHFHSRLSSSSRGSFLFAFCHKGGIICISEVIDFHLAILIPACALSSLAFLMMYSAYKLNKQGDYVQLWCTPFQILNLSVVPYPALTVAPSPVYRFLRKQVRWSGIPIFWRISHSFLLST